MRRCKAGSPGGIVGLPPRGAVSKGGRPIVRCAPRPPLFPKPSPQLLPNTYAYKSRPMVKPTGFREYDARWLFEQEINLMGAQALGLGLARLLSELGVRREIVVGHDFRSYSASIKLAMSAGLMAGGAKVRDIGLAITPMAYLAQFALDTPAVAMVTASHNDNGWTGVKMGASRPLTFGPEEMARLRDIVIAGEYRYEAGGGYEFVADFPARYIADLTARPKLTRRLKVVAACGNGTAGAFAPKLLSALGVEVVPLDCDLDFTFPHYNPNPEDMQMLHAMAAAVMQTGADLALGFDGDGDRCGVVDNEGAEIFADKIGVMLARAASSAPPPRRTRRSSGRSAPSASTGSSLSTPSVASSRRTTSGSSAASSNATVNCIDRHVHSDRRNKAALIWVGEDGDEHAYTYNRLYREVNRFANALKRLGVGKGDRGDRLHAARARGHHHHARLRAHRRHPLGGLRRHGHAGPAFAHRRLGRQGRRLPATSPSGAARRSPLKPTVDEAVRDLTFVEHVVVHRRGSRPGDAPVTFESDREVDFYDIQQAREIHCHPEPMDAEDPLFILYTSGTTGQAEGRGAHHRRLPRRRHLSRARLLPDRRARHLLEHLGHRLDRRPLVHRLRSALGRRDGLLPRGRARLSRRPT